MGKGIECPPVMICGFNRPDYLREVFGRVREAKPSRLFLVLDAPRDNHPEDISRYNECRNIFNQVDWECDVYRDYAERNLGCRRRMESGISNVFRFVEECIILEDDCVPHLDFFRFCGEMLCRYKDDCRIGMVAGFREHPYLRVRTESYYFTRFTQIWGWATWKRAWKCYGKVLPKWDIDKARIALEPIFREKALVERVLGWFDDACYGRSNSWATVWWMTNVFENFLTIHPSVNMVTNIGGVGCHNTKFNPEFHNVRSVGLKWPLVHPEFIMPDAIDEAIVRKRMAPRVSLKQLVVFFMRKLGLR